MKPNHTEFGPKSLNILRYSVWSGPSHRDCRSLKEFWLFQTNGEPWINQIIGKLIF